MQTAFYPIFVVWSAVAPIVFSLNHCHDCLCDSRRQVFCNDTLKAPMDLRFPNDQKDYHFENNNMKSLDPHSFSKLANLQWVYLTRNLLTSLPGKVFYSNPNLQAIYLSYNQLTSLPSKLFNKNPLLQEFYCDNNNLTHIDQYLFAGLSKLRQIRLNNNQLTAVHPAAFQSCVALSSLYLENNRLETAYWQWIAKLQQDTHTEIELDTNNWSCDCRMWQFVYNVTKHSWFNNPRSTRLNYPRCADGIDLMAKKKHDLTCTKSTFAETLATGQIDIHTAEGKEANITCSATGVPIPYLTLFNGRHQVLKKDKGKIVYEFKPVKRGQLGWYTCMMEGIDNKGRPFVKNVTINFGPVSMGSMSVGSVFAILLAVIFVLGVASCFWRKRRRRDGYGSLHNTGDVGSAYYELDDSASPDPPQKTTSLEEENLFSDEEVYSKGDDKEVLV